MNFKTLLTPAIKWVFQIPKSQAPGMHVYIYPHSELKFFKKQFAKLNADHDLKFVSGDSVETPQAITKLKSSKGAVWICYFSPDSGYLSSRDLCGSIYQFCKSEDIKSVAFKILGFKGNSKQALEEGLVVGLENANYHFLNQFKNKSSDFKTEFYLTENKVQLKKYSAQAAAMLMARHLVNLPPNAINPRTYADLIKKDIPFSKNTSVEIWNSEKCKAERMNLLLAVGAGSEHTACMVHIKYRPSKGKKNVAPIAFVGKGITFDTGGLDIKPSSAMRLMKKDMGGSAAVAALAYWVDASGYDRPCDFYLALAENSIDSKAMRPSDVYQSRAGYWVEIDNTDAEGRLVLADVMDVAVTRKEKPSHLIDIATLTGAIKVALGADIAGLFSNDDSLAKQIHEAGEKIGEPNWRMPLVSKYFSQLTSHFADFRNSADGFGGAITAALFLEKFAGGIHEDGKNKKSQAIKWAHLDVYSWNDKPNGALLTTGGSGQPVQTMIEWLRSL
jgi:leucyl aminopeptidase